MMEFNQTPEIAKFAFCVVTFRIHFPVLHPECETEAGVDDLSVARKDDALPPAFFQVIC